MLSKLKATKLGQIVRAEAIPTAVGAVVLGLLLGPLTGAYVAAGWIGLPIVGMGLERAWAAARELDPRTCARTEKGRLARIYRASSVDSLVSWTLDTTGPVVRRLLGREAKAPLVRVNPPKDTLLGAGLWAGFIGSAFLITALPILGIPLMVATGVPVLSRLAVENYRWDTGPRPRAYLVTRALASATARQAETTERELQGRSVPDVPSAAEPKLSFGTARPPQPPGTGRPGIGE